MAKLVCDGFELKLSAVDILNAEFEITSTASSDILIGSSGVCFDRITATLTSATYNGLPLAGPVAFIINGSCEDVLEGSKKAVLDTDESSDATLNFVSGSSTVPYPNAVKMQIKDAGQDDVEV